MFRLHQASTGLDILRVVKISQAQGWQRAGRAGRDAEGNCYRMLTRNVSLLLLFLVEGNNYVNKWQLTRAMF